MMPACRDSQPPQSTPPQDDVTMLKQPDTGADHERIALEGIGRRSPQRGNQARLSLLVQMAKAENLYGSLLMVEQGSPSAIQGADRSDPWRALITLELRIEMIQHRTRDELDRIQRRASHRQVTLW